MRHTIKTAAAGSATLLLAVGLSACGGGSDASTGSSNSGSSSLSGTVSAGGSSAQEAAMGAWRSAFQSSNPNVTINYEPVGSGGGREQFTSGGYPFAATDSALDDTELTAAKKQCGADPIEVPTYISPIAVVYNLSGVDKLNLSAETLGKIFSGQITKWDDPAIKADNPGVSLPSDAITPVHRSDESGTSQNFTDYLSQAGNGSWKAEASSTWPTDIKGGEGAEGTSGVIQAVTNGAGTIGYADDSQAGQLSKANIKVGSAWVAPSAEGASKVLDLSKPMPNRPATDMAVSVDRTTTESGAYPLLLASYVVACPTYSDKATADIIKGFLSYVVSSNGQQAAAQAAGSAPLSADLSKKAGDLVNQISAG
ncbi:MAG: phosphate transport system substrate-binding protein [Nocardioidaceae bacterium]|nr:phosphate transport system substrate-binding protein [Nocardioidaceae bacterium]